MSYNFHNWSRAVKHNRRSKTHISHNIYRVHDIPDGNNSHHRPKTSMNSWGHTYQCNYFVLDQALNHSAFVSYYGAQKFHFPNRVLPSTRVESERLKSSGDCNTGHEMALTFPIGLRFQQVLVTNVPEVEFPVLAAALLWPHGNGFLTLEVRPVFPRRSGPSSETREDCVILWEWLWEYKTMMDRA